MSALPMEVTRSDTCKGLPSNLTSQLPAIGFNLSKDFCASDCARAMVESDIRTTVSIKRRDLIFILLKSFFFRAFHYLVRRRSKCAWIGLSFIMKVQSSV